MAHRVNQTYQIYSVNHSRSPSSLQFYLTPCYFPSETLGDCHVSIQGQTLSVEATAYTAECEGCSGITATGINLLENRDKSH